MMEKPVRYEEQAIDQMALTTRGQKIILGEVTNLRSQFAISNCKKNYVLWAKDKR